MQVMTERDHEHLHSGWIALDDDCLGGGQGGANPVVVRPARRPMSPLWRVPLRKTVRNTGS